MRPIFLEPIYKDYIWGGTRLKNEYNKVNTDKETIAETWEISTNPNGKCIIKNQSEYEYNTLYELFKNTVNKEKIFGKKCVSLEEFPLLVKFIDANSNLSVQVHPNDEYAKLNENSLGKTEMWYVVDCGENAKLICGMKDTVKQEDVKKIILNNEIKENINYVNIQKGDIIYIPAGTIHALLEGALICEVQQNCDLTYRVYDWDRVDKDGNKRQLHVEKAIDVIDVNSEYQIKKVEEKTNGVVEVLNTNYFNVQIMNVDDSLECESDFNTFWGMNVLDGNGKIILDNMEYIISKGDSFIIPASLGKFKIEGNLKILNSYI